jgi:hypothetical protein
MDLAVVGAVLRSHYHFASDFKKSIFYKGTRAAFKHAFVARGGKSANVKSYWARAMYREAWPGQGRVNGIYYKRLPDGSVVQDVERNRAPVVVFMEVDDEDAMEVM